ncbi:hypothetical protein Syun_019875 [Stephania yunnanensis]|uniref:Uncharacterized protein n=1 Tax=Stephania yunnanensis TaxID=152371 RepID=A0AAP0NX27_9MAGN
MEMEAKVAITRQSVGRAKICLIHVLCTYMEMENVAIYGAEIRIDYQAKCGSCYNIDEYPSFKFFGDPTGILVYDGWGCRGEASALTTSHTNRCFHGTNEKDGVSFFVICDAPPPATDMK